MLFTLAIFHRYIRCGEDIGEEIHGIVNHNWFAIRH